MILLKFLKIYQQLEKIDRLEDPKKRAAYNRAVAVDTAKGLGSGFARGTTYALGLPNLAENVLGYGTNKIAGFFRFSVIRSKSTIFSRKYFVSFNSRNSKNSFTVYTRC